MAIVDSERNDNLYSTDAYVANTDNWEDSVSIYRSKALMAAVNEAKILNEITSVLDVGCGSGGVLAHFSDELKCCSSEQDKEIRLRGIDISEIAIGFAKRLHPSESHSDLQYDKASVLNYEEGRSYSLITLIHVLEHCPDMLEMLDVCAGRAKYVYINVPLEVNILYSLRGSVLKSQYIKYGHLHFFDRNFIIAFVESNGFEIVSEVFSPDFEVKKPGIVYNSVRYIRRWLGQIDPEFATRLLGGYSLGLLVKRS